MTRGRPYADRSEAGRVLAGTVVEALARAAPPGGGSRPAPGAAPVVLALPRGGVPVAAPVAAALGAPLDVLVVRKLGLPGQPELAMGAVAGVGGEVELVRNVSVLELADVPDEQFDRVRRREVDELRRREDDYRRGRGPVAVRDRTVVLVDDGIATGSTVLAAVAAARRQGPSRVVVAVPVAPPEAVRRLGEAADMVVCPWTPRDFTSVGRAYRDFTQTDDEQVRTALQAGADGRCDSRTEG